LETYLLLLQVLLVSYIRGEMMDWLVNSGDFDSIPQTSANCTFSHVRSRGLLSTVWQTMRYQLRGRLRSPDQLVFAGVFLHMVIEKYFLSVHALLFEEIITVLPMLILFKIIVFVNVN